MLFAKCLMLHLNEIESVVIINYNSVSFYVSLMTSLLPIVVNTYPCPLYSIGC